MDNESVNWCEKLFHRRMQIGLSTVNHGGIVLFPATRQWRPLRVLCFNSYKRNSSFVSLRFECCNMNVLFLSISMVEGLHGVLSLAKPRLLLLRVVSKCAVYQL